MKRQRVRTFVASLKKYDVEYGCSLPKFLSLIEDIVSDIPEADRENVTVDWTDGNECDSGYIEFEHYRDETDQEMASRVAEERGLAAARAAQQEAREREVLAALKARYESHS